jgi:osmotically inducible lipoprotein OsmB
MAHRSVAQREARDCTLGCAATTRKVARFLQRSKFTVRTLDGTGGRDPRDPKQFPFGVNSMNTKIVSAAVLAVSLLGLGGCATMDRQTVGTVGGAAVGGLVGSAIGGTGATILGAGAGALVGNQMTKPGHTLNK